MIHITFIFFFKQALLIHILNHVLVFYLNLMNKQNIWRKIMYYFTISNVDFIICFMQIINNYIVKNEDENQIIITYCT